MSNKQITRYSLLGFHRRARHLRQWFQELQRFQREDVLGRRAGTDDPQHVAGQALILAETGYLPLAIRTVEVLIEKHPEQAQLHELYPSHGVYVNQVAHDVSNLVLDRFITRSDGAALITEAAQANVP